MFCAFNFGNKFLTFLEFKGNGIGTSFYMITVGVVKIPFRLTVDHRNCHAFSHQKLLFPLKIKLSHRFGINTLSNGFSCSSKRYSSGCGIQNALIYFSSTNSKLNFPNYVVIHQKFFYNKPLMTSFCQFFENVERKNADFLNVMFSHNQFPCHSAIT